MFNGVLSTSTLKHKPNVVKELFSNKGDSVVANDKLYILFPERYIKKSLATMGATAELLSMFAVVDEAFNYGVIVAPIMMTISPDNVTDVMVDGVINKVLVINKGSVFITNRKLLRIDTFMYNLFDEFFLQGNVPWYITYDKLSDIFIEAKKYADSNVGNDVLAIEIVSSIISRNAKNKTMSYRHTITKGINKTPPVYVGLNNVYYSYDNTLSKVMGGYFQQGVTTAIVNRETETNKVSSLLRA